MGVFLLPPAFKMNVDTFQSHSLCRSQQSFSTAIHSLPPTSLRCVFLSMEVRHLRNAPRHLKTSFLSSPVNQHLLCEVLQSREKSQGLGLRLPSMTCWLSHWDWACFCLSVHVLIEPHRVVVKTTERAFLNWSRGRLTALMVNGRFQFVLISSFITNVYQRWHSAPLASLERLGVCKAHRHAD